MNDDVDRVEHFFETKRWYSTAYVAGAMNITIPRARSALKLMVDEGNLEVSRDEYGQKVYALPVR